MNRRERRQAYKSMGILKAKNKLSPLSTERCEIRRRNRADGEAKHRAMLDEYDKLTYEQVEHASSKYEKKLKAAGYDTTEIEMLMEAFALENIKHKETYKADRKKAKELKAAAKKSKQLRTV
jgi:hypothetical protein